MSPTPARRLRTSRNRSPGLLGDATALLAMLGRYWLSIFPVARQELGRWRARAESIPDEGLRCLATRTLAAEGLNAEGAALFATLAPRGCRGAIARLLVCLQVMYDYLDALTEQPTAEPFETSQRLHRSLLEALGAPSSGWGIEARVPYGSDNGYLAALVASCRAALGALPAGPVVARRVLEAAHRSAEGQSHSHAAVSNGAEDLIRWAIGASPPALGLAWWETAAASESSLVLHALLASAARPGLTHDDAERISAAYWPWITGLNALLDDLIDSAEDVREGTHSYARNYATSSQLAQRLELFAGRASAAVRELPDGRRHAVILAAMASFYLSAPEAELPDVRPAARLVRRQLDVDVRLLLAVLRLRRRLARR